MLKTLTALSALAIMLAAPAYADIRFEGNIEFTAKTRACPSSIKLNTQWRSRYHPGNTFAPGNSDWTGFNRVEEFAAQAWGKDGDFSATTFQKVVNGSMTDRFSGLTVEDGPGSSRTKLKLSAAPPTITTATKGLVLRGKIKNPLNKASQDNCIVDFVGTYQNRDYLLN